MGLRRMQDRGVEPNGVTFNTAIAARATSGAWEDASEVFAAMRGHGIRATPYTQTNLTNTFAGSPLDGLAEDLVRESRNSVAFATKPVSTSSDGTGDATSEAPPQQF